MGHEAPGSRSPLPLPPLPGQTTWPWSGATGCHAPPSRRFWPSLSAAPPPGRRGQAVPGLCRARRLSPSAAMASLLPRCAAAARRRFLLRPAPLAPGPVRAASQALSAALVRRGGLVGGRWVETAAAFPVQDPASGEELGRVSDCGAAEARAAVRAAHEAGAAWGRLPAKVSGRGRWRRGSPGAVRFCRVSRGVASPSLREAATIALSLPSCQERSARLRRWYELMIENKEELARIITAENVSGAAGVGTDAAGETTQAGEKGHK